MQFNMLINKFKTAAVVVYCDKNDREQYQKVLRAMCKARQEMPLYLKSDEDGNQVSGNSDVLFIVSTIKELMPVTKLKQEGVQALYVHP
jgi:hypothetical protein